MSMQTVRLTGQINRKRPRHDDVVTPQPVIKVEPVDQHQWNARTPAPRSRGQVMCGHCQTRRASVCCMEESCVLFAERKWRMTTMLICPECDNTIHDNPVMADHYRTSLSVRGLTVCPIEEFEDLPRNSAAITTEEVHPASLVEHPQDFDARTISSPTPPPRSDGTASPAFTVSFAEALSASNAADDSPQTCTRQSISVGNLTHVHKRYAIVLEHHLTHRCPLLDTFKQTNVPRQTLMDTLALAELKIVDPERFDDFMAVVKQRRMSNKVADMERTCRAIIKESYKAQIQSLRGKTLLPINVNVYD